MPKSQPKNYGDRVNAVTSPPNGTKIISVLVPSPHEQLINVDFTESYLPLVEIELQQLNQNINRNINTLVWIN
jgi:hypothetical protein